MRGTCHEVKCVKGHLHGSCVAVLLKLKMAQDGVFILMAFRLMVLPVIRIIRTPRPLDLGFHHHHLWVYKGSDGPRPSKWVEAAYFRYSWSLYPLTWAL